MTYRVRITADAEAAILDQARYIAVDCDAPINAARWLNRILNAADTLETLPRRCQEADESRSRPYEVRRLLVDGHHLLFTVVEETKTVWVIGFRHGRQLERAEELPETPERFNDAP